MQPTVAVRTLDAVAVTNKHAHTQKKTGYKEDGDKAGEGSSSPASGQHPAASTQHPAASTGAKVGEKKSEEEEELTDDETRLMVGLMVLHGSRRWWLGLDVLAGFRGTVLDVACHATFRPALPYHSMP